MKTIEENENFYFWEKISMPKKLKGGTLCDFSTSIVAKPKKMQGDPSGKKIFEKKSHSAEKK